jgi:hypothetical protein
MPAALQNLSIAELAYVGMVAVSLIVFWVCLFAVWAYVNLGAGPKPRRVAVVPAVRPTQIAAPPEDLKTAA